jgi:hypothetical protein
MGAPPLVTEDAADAVGLHKTQRTQWAYRVVSKEIAVRAGSLETETTEQTTRRDSRVCYTFGEQDSWERAQLQGGARQHGSTQRCMFESECTECEGLVVRHSETVRKSDGVRARARCRRYALQHKH